MCIRDRASLGNTFVTLFISSFILGNSTATSIAFLIAHSSTSSKNIAYLAWAYSIVYFYKQEKRLLSLEDKEKEDFSLVFNYDALVAEAPPPPPPLHSEMEQEVKE
eukprot:TRINITY_DN8898_c0_g1_i1.p1 TRINITY_DN8898_c0_g1~~TRINITY_DN8898_c0_g1_i1.p1  ORF type:complete len:106 (+),score=30.28 TRINITY_DN8898_c0_g1_i1:64-381(+)